MRRTVRRGSPSSAHRCSARASAQPCRAVLRAPVICCALALSPCRPLVHRCTRLFARLARCLLASLLLPSGTARARAHGGVRACVGLCGGGACMRGPYAARDHREPRAQRVEDVRAIRARDAASPHQGRTEPRPPPPRPSGWCNAVRMGSDLSRRGAAPCASPTRGHGCMRARLTLVSAPRAPLRAFARGSCAQSRARVRGNRRR